MSPPPKVSPDTELTDRLWNWLIDYVVWLSRPRVASPLAVKDDVIYLNDEFKIFNCKTTSTISARSSTQMGTGTVDLYVPNQSGVLAKYAGIADRTVYSDIGTQIPSGIFGKCYFGHGIWQMFNGDCSGVA